MPPSGDTDRLVTLRVAGLRSLGDVELGLDGLKLLIGENGSGKSTIVESLQLLHELGAGKLSESFLRWHGGFAEALRDGATNITLEARAAIGGQKATYRLVLENMGFGAVVVAEERLDLDLGAPQPLRVIERDRKRAKVFSQAERKQVAIDVAADEPLLTAFGRLPPQAAIEPLRRLFAGIDVRPALPVAPGWATRMSGRDNPLREPSLVQPITRLSALGDDLAAAYHVLRNDRPSAHWNETLALVRLGLGPDVDLLSPPDAGAGKVGLALMIRGRKRFAVQLSDGTLSFLALVAACRLGEGRSVLVLDEPDAHLHPALQATVMTLVEAVAAQHPVVIATHSDTLLDCLSDPVASAIVCELTEAGETRLRALDKGALANWMRDYRGLGALRSDGWLGQILDEAG